MMAVAAAVGHPRRSPLLSPSPCPSLAVVALLPHALELYLLCAHLMSLSPRPDRIRRHVPEEQPSPSCPRGSPPPTTYVGPSLSSLPADRMMLYTSQLCTKRTLQQLDVTVDDFYQQMSKVWRQLDSLGSDVCRICPCCVRLRAHQKTHYLYYFLTP